MSKIAPRAGGLAALFVLLATSPLYADDCSTLGDCWNQLLVAALVLAAIVVLSALFWEMWVAAGAIELGMAIAAGEAAAGGDAAVVAAGGALGSLGAADLAGEQAGAEGIGSVGDMIANEEAAAESRLQSIAEQANPFRATGGRNNCSWVAREIEQALADLFAGRDPDPYAPDWYDPSYAPNATIRGEGNVSLSRAASFEQEYGGTFNQTSMQGIADQLGQAGNGSRGIVSVSQTTTDAAGNIVTRAHAFNAVNYGGEVYFVDGQSGAVWTDVSQMSGYDPSKAIVRFLVTN